ncbi:MAG TPA: hypothetical protein VMF68_12805 [Spirochaetia bacterium]|nr:hypothetical protein [Spirochaetia bacterium]
MDRSLEIVKRLRSGSGPAACIFVPRKAGTSPAYQQIVQGLRDALSGVLRVEVVDEEFLYSFDALFRSPVDLLVLPGLEAVPDTAYRILKKYLVKGGALLLSAQDLFLRKIEETYLPLFETRKHYPDDYFRRTVAYLGIKPYVAERGPQAAVPDLDFLPSLGPRIESALPPQGAFCTTGSDVLHSDPPFGHVFPERYPVCRNYVAVKGVDAAGSHVTSSAVFSQNWENGSRMVVVPSNEPGGLLDPSRSWFSSFVKAAATFCLGRTMIEYVEPGYACYRPGEAVGARCRVRSFEKAEVEAELEVLVAAGGAPLGQFNRRIRVAAGGTHVETFDSLPVSPSEDVHTISVKLRINGAVQSRAVNGFVVWREEIAARGPTISASDKYFTCNGTTSLLVGSNYYESQIGELQWLRPNVERLDADLRQMASCGVRYVRIHYHHPKWFRDYFEYMHGMVPEYFQQEQGPLPDERILRVFDAHVYLFQKHGIVYGGDLFTLLPEELGDPRGWYGVHDYASVAEKSGSQRRFLELLIARYRNIPGIAWDLYNEPKGVDDQVFLKWAEATRTMIRELGDRHPLTVGTEKPERFDSAADFYAEHRNFAAAGQVRARTPKPELLQEVWLDRPPTKEGDAAQRADMRQALLAAFGSGQGGFSPWQWTNQARLRSDYLTYIGEIWDDRLGCCARDDGTLKPAGEFYRDFAQVVQGIPILSHEGSAFRTPKGLLEIKPLGQKPPERGELLISYHENGTLFRGLACGRLEWGGQVLLDSDQGAGRDAAHGADQDAGPDADIWFFAPAGVSPKAELWFKVSRPGRLAVAREGKLARVSLRPSVHSPLELGSIPAALRDGNMVLTLEPWHCGFWIHLGTEGVAR